MAIAFHPGFFGLIDLVLSDLLPFAYFHPTDSPNRSTIRVQMLSGHLPAMRRKKQVALIDSLRVSAPQLS
jgi:hypothetical protein